MEACVSLLKSTRVSLKCRHALASFEEGVHNTALNLTLAG